jgi:diaminohydroxyphosphoribosylaminopyrimidine deaminase/5-amino-6-(5-phosphoribosylamino)uracil reductase
MRRALALARRGRGRTSPNPMVGAVVAKAGRIIAEGYHRRAGEPHAEALALQRAGPEARGATLYVTLEPCCHHGRTPPCTDAIIASGVRRVVAAMRDPNPLVAGKGLRRLRRAGIEVEVGLLEEQARRLNEAYCHRITTGRPFVTLKLAASLDGKIATRTGSSRWITAQAARLHVHRLRAESDAVMVGIGTALADDPRLTGQLGAMRQPIRVVVDSRARLPTDAAMLREPGGPVIVAATLRAPRSRVAALRRAGAEVLLLRERQGRVDLRALLEALGRRGITSLLVEGGSEIAGSLLDAHLVNKFVLFLAPILVGGARAPMIAAGRGVARLSEALRLDRLAVRRLGPDLVITGYST